MKNKIIITSIVAIAIILAVVFLSQQPVVKSFKFSLPFSLPKGENTYNSDNGNGSYLSRINDWLGANVYSKINSVSSGISEKSGEALEAIKEGAAEKEEAIKNEINEQKANIEEKLSNKIKKSIAAKVLGVLGVEPQELLAEEQKELCADK